MTKETRNNSELTPDALESFNDLNCSVETDLKPVLDAINERLGIEMISRSDEFHFTIISPPERTKAFSQLTGENFEKLNEIYANIQKGQGYQINGIGFIDGATQSNLRESDKNKKVAYIAIEVPELNILREKLGLDKKDFHITLGFVENDIHMEIVGKNSKGKPVLGKVAKKASPELADIKIPELVFGNITGGEKAKKAAKVEEVKKNGPVLKGIDEVRSGISKLLSEGIIDSGEGDLIMETVEAGKVNDLGRAFGKRMNAIRPILFK